jgi:hypothetical protein
MNHLKAILLTLTVIVVMAGCGRRLSNKAVPKPVAKDIGSRFTSSNPNESKFKDFRVLAQKNQAIGKQNANLKKRNDELVADNKRLMKRFDAMQSNLNIAEKELMDANEMLIEMRKELDGWKANVLGFREESNYVHKEQVKALVKILKLLGAEYKEGE